jgi:DNA-nicking Smr family endonuclease
MMGDCQHCGTQVLPTLLSDTIEINIKRGGPSAEEALDRLTHQLRRASEVGLKVILLIHGYGSSGEGGRIKKVVREALENNYFSDRVDEFYYGEGVADGSESYHALLRRRPSLKRHLQLFKQGNAGMTILLLA